MYQFQKEGITAITLYLFISVLIPAAILLVSLYSTKARHFFKSMLSGWKTALLITVIYFVFAIIGSNFSVIFIFWSVGLFLQVLVGLAISRDTQKDYPFPVTVRLRTHNRALHSYMLMLGIALAGSLCIMVTSAVSMGIGQLFGENNKQSIITELFPENGFRAFFSTLAGAGIIEGVTYRLIVLSFVYRLIKKKMPAIIISALIFAIYHFSPLNMMHHVYWQMPITQFLNVMFGAGVLGYIYLKRGFETSVLSHTLADWLPLILFIYFM